MYRKRKIADFFKIFATCISTLISVVILFSIIFYVFKNGFSSLSFKFLTSNYNDSLNIAGCKLRITPDVYRPCHEYILS